MKTLFIDTHSEVVTVILVDEDNHEYRLEKTSDRSHSEIAVPLIEQLLNETGTYKTEIGSIVVVNGPGSFTGVRIGVTIAKTMAYTMGVPIKAITSLEMYGVSSEEKFNLVTVEDSKGVYSALRSDGVYKDFMYQSKSDFKEYVESNKYILLEKREIDIIRILDYLKDKEEINPHLVNPIYIKEIDALK